MSVAQPTPSAKKRILIVDDKASDTLLVKSCLEQTSLYVVREVNDARTALAVAEEFHPQLILLDIRMPGMDGGELAANFREHPKLSAVPIVFLTALVTPGEAKANDGWLGLYPLLAKPIFLPDLLACVKRLVGG